MEGYITDIQRFSLNDGDGIRTTVFFKGCNMHCTWCHNPETIEFKNNVLLYQNNCIGCGRCFKVCAQCAHITENGVHKIDYSKCVSCGECVDKCYAEALKFSAKKMTSDEVLAQIVQDIPYYEQSDGGVTLSGGEVFCQTEFADEIISKCRLRKIKTAVETNLCHDFDKIEKTLAKLDLIMFDIKLFDGETHKKYTDADNKIIFENAKKADKLGIPIIVRTPLIPDVTDGAENLKNIAEFVKTLKNARYYELLNFNPLGGSKYKAMDKNNDFASAKPFSQNRLDEIKNALSGYNVKIG